jgi:hypothetical protein
MNRDISKLTLDKPVIYQITAPGFLDAKWIGDERMFT